MSVIDLFKNVALLTGLSDSQLGAVAELCQERTYPAGSTILDQGDMGDEAYVIQEGQVEIVLVGTKQELPIVVLGRGQVLGEMSLIDHGYRSATARATERTTVQIIREEDFTALCERDHHTGYLVMRNLAADLSFKVRHRNLTVM